MPATTRQPATRHRWFPGYTMAAVATVGLIATAPGQTFVVSLLNTSLTTELEIEPLALNTAYMAATVAAAFPLVLIGKLTDRLGPRRALALVATAFGLGCMAMAGVSGIVSLCLGFFLIRFLGQGSLSLVSQHTVAMWFHERLGMVSGIKQVILYGAWIGLPPLTLFLIGDFGWRATYVIFGTAIIATIVPLALLLVRDRPEDLGLTVDNRPRMDAPATSTTTHERADGIGDPTITVFTLRDAIRTRAYWTLAAVFFLSPLVGTALLFDIQPIVAARGLGPSFAAVAVSTWTTSMAVMSFPSGVVADRIRPPIVLTLGMGSIALCAGVLHLADTPATIIFAITALGVGISLSNASAAATVARYFGRTHHGAIRGSISRLAGIGTGIGPLCTGLSVHFTGSYDAALLGFAVVAVPLLLATATLTAPPLPRPSPGR